MRLNDTLVTPFVLAGIPATLMDHLVRKAEISRYPFCTSICLWSSGDIGFYRTMAAPSGKVFDGYRFGRDTHRFSTWITGGMSGAWFLISPSREHSFQFREKYSNQLLDHAIEDSLWKEFYGRYSSQLWRMMGSLSVRDITANGITGYVG